MWRMLPRCRRSDRGGAIEGVRAGEDVPELTGLGSRRVRPGGSSSTWW